MAKNCGGVTPAVRNGTRVRVHWNLTRGGFVVRGLPMRPGDMQYVDSVCIRNATFKATPAGAAYCRGFVNKKTGKVGARFVVAWVEGERCDCHAVSGESTLATYNPFRGDEFVRCDDGTPVRTASHVVFTTVGRGKTSKPVTACEGARS